MSAPALGPLRGLPRRSVLVRLGTVAALLAVALAVRASGVLHPDTSTALPPLPAVAAVVPGVVRSATPAETDLVQLRNTYAVHTIVSVVPPSVAEQAVVAALGMALVRLDVAPGDAPTAGQVRELRRIVDAGGGRVVLHDDTGDGPVLVTAAALQLAVGLPLDRVLADLDPAAASVLTPVQRRALTDIAAAVGGPADPANPYAELAR
jgi:hypothetical protein